MNAEEAEATGPGSRRFTLTCNVWLKETPMEVRTCGVGRPSFSSLAAARLRSCMVEGALESTWEARVVMFAPA